MLDEADMGYTDANIKDLFGGLGVGSPRSLEELRGYSDVGDFMQFSYRAVSFSVPKDWYLAYRRDLEELHARGMPTLVVGTVSSVTEFLDWAWSDLLEDWAEVGAASGSWARMLSCYNLPTTEMPNRISAQFFHYSWGPPYSVFAATNVLVLSTVAQIQDICSGTDVCEDFPDFIETMLRGETAVNRLGVGPCGLRFRFMNSDTDNAFVPSTGMSEDTIACGSLRGETFACNEGFEAEADPVDLGNDWAYNFPARFDLNARAWVSDKQESHPYQSHSESPKEKDTARNYVSNGSWIFTSRPEHLAWHGFLIDWILYLARMAHDIARDPSASLTLVERLEFMQKAYELGRYALRILVWRGEILIHELGHVHAGKGGHCSVGSGCHELSAQRWKCAVIAKYGLPFHSGNSSHTSTWSTDSATWYDDYISSQDRGIRYLNWHPLELSCDVHSIGTARGSYSFSCYSCQSYEVGSERVLGWGS